VSSRAHNEVQGQLKKANDETEQLRSRVVKLLTTEADLKHQADFSAACATKLLMDNRALQLELDVNSPKLLLELQVQVQYELMTQQKAALEAQLDAENEAWQERCAWQR
jgi:hypothetical protein